MIKIQLIEIFLYIRYVKGWCEFVTAVHLCMKISITREQKKIIEKKLSNFYRHITR